jgi:hypothetical protein
MELRSETAWKKAAACDAHARLTQDEILRAKFERLRDSWLRIANDAEVTSRRGTSRAPGNQHD